VRNIVRSPALSNAGGLFIDRTLMERSMTKETDARDRSDEPNTKQTNEPWKGVPEKEQAPTKKGPDLEKWNDTNTH
jgi:hypothetical protein